DEQPWARMDALAWIGFSRGAQQTEAFLNEFSEAAPDLYVRAGGGEFTPGSELKDSRLSQVLLAHGEKDQVFSLDTAKAVRAALEAASIPVDLRILSGLGHAFGADRQLVIRTIGEYTKSFLTPEEPLPTLPVTKDYWFALCIAPAV